MDCVCVCVCVCVRARVKETSSMDNNISYMYIQKHCPSETLSMFIHIKAIIMHQWSLNELHLIELMNDYQATPKPH